MNLMPIKANFTPIKQIAFSLDELNNSKSAEVTNNIGFGAILKQQLEQVNSVIQTANKSAEQFELGEQNIDIPALMIKEQHAQLAFSALVETRNKLMHAYQEIMHMQI